MIEKSELKKVLGIKNWILSPYVRVTVGYHKTVVCDFKMEKAYQISKIMGEFLTVVISNSVRAEQESLFKQWITKRREILSKQVILAFKEYLDKLKYLGILIPLDKFPSEEILIPGFEPSLPLQPPYLCTLELTSRCNFRCPHCYVGDKSLPQDLEFNIVCSLLQQIKNMGVQIVQLTGGEIFLRKDLGEILKIAHKLGLEIEITTNGSLLSDDAIVLIKNYVKKIQITIYGFSKKIYACFSGDSTSFDKVLSNIEKLIKRNASNLELAFTITPYNYHDVDNFFKFCNERGIESKIGKMLPIGLALREKKALLESHYNTFLNDVEAKYVKKSGPLFRTRACTSDMLTVLADGRVVICPLARELQFTLGNIYSETLKNIWYGKAIPYFESLHVDNLEVCKGCEFKYLCGGGCPALWPPWTRKSLPCKVYYTRKFFTRNCEFQ